MVWTLSCVVQSFPCMLLLPANIILITSVLTLVQQELWCKHWRFFMRLIVLTCWTVCYWASGRIDGGSRFWSVVLADTAGVYQSCSAWLYCGLITVGTSMFPNLGARFWFDNLCWPVEGQLLSLCPTQPCLPSKSFYSGWVCNCPAFCAEPNTLLHTCCEVGQWAAVAPPHSTQRWESQWWRPVGWWTCPEALRLFTGKLLI